MHDKPYGGKAILIRKHYRNIAQLPAFQCSRLLGVELTCDDVSMLFISVYMTYQCKDNFELFREYIGKISAVIEKSLTSNIATIGDFNVAIDTQLHANCRITEIM